MNIDPKARLKKTQNEVIGSKVGDDLMLMNMGTGDYIHFNELGTVIWEKLEEYRTIEDLVQSLIMEYEISKDLCMDEVEQFVFYLIDNKLLKEE